MQSAEETIVRTVWPAKGTANEEALRFALASAAWMRSVEDGHDEPVRLVRAFLAAEAAKVSARFV